MHARAPFSPVLQGRESGEDGGWSGGSGGEEGAAVGAHGGCGGCGLVVMNVAPVKKNSVSLPRRGRNKGGGGERGRCGRRCCGRGCVVLMEQSSLQLGKLSSHPNMCIFVCV